MPWRLGLAVLSCALLAGWWVTGARGEPMPSGAVAPPPPPGLWDAAAQPPSAAAEKPSKPAAALPGAAFPYRATIAAEPASVRSGPGEEFYETTHLRLGDEVEVYRHDPHGWCAIRPPQGSFSYVPAEYLKGVDDGLAETTVAGVKSFVGSSLGEHRDRSHVSLRRGERVELLEKPAAEGLCKIAPPAGEFRWVHEKCLTRLGPIAGDASAVGAGDPGSVDQGGTDQGAADRGDERPSAPSAKWRAAPRTTAFHVPDDPQPAHDARPTSGPASEGGVGQRSASDNHSVSVRKSRRPTLPQRGWIRPSFSAAEEADEPGDASPPLPPAPMEKVVETTPASPPPGDEFLGAALDEINLELARVVCQPKNRWTLEPVRDATKEVLRRAEAPADRVRARRLLDRIAQFEEVRRQSLGLPATVTDETSFKMAAAEKTPGGGPPAPRSPGRPVTAEAGAPPKPAAESASATPVPPNWEDPRFDGSGRLVPLEKRGDGDPQFLLVDDQGVARYFVTAAPGVNLRAYRDRVVGITGSRTEDLERGKPHLTAQRVTLLSDAPPRR
jgi:hypothetical protein